MLKTTRFFLAFTVLTLTGLNANADCIPISSVPYVISQSGSYCLTADFSASFSNTAISIEASHVDLDLQGHTITNTASVVGSISGIEFHTRETISTDVTVHNGGLSGFLNGILLTYRAENVEVSNLTVDHMTVQSSSSRGIVVYGSNVKVTNNRVTGTRNTTSATGIEIQSAGAGRNLTASNRAVVQGNVVIKTSSGAISTWGSAVGISVSGYSDLLIRDNSVSSTWVGGAAASDSRAVGIDISQMTGVCGGLCASDPIGGLIVQDNNVVNSAILLRTANPNSTGILIGYPGDHAIVRGSIIANMNTGINAAYRSWPNTPPVLLLDSTITGSTTPIIGGVTLPQ